MVREKETKISDGFAPTRGVRARRHVLPGAQPGCTGHRFSRLLPSGLWEHIPRVRGLSQSRNQTGSIGTGWGRCSIG
jgi:hypothetical protein